MFSSEENNMSNETTIRASLHSEIHKLIVRVHHSFEMHDQQELKQLAERASNSENAHIWESMTIVAIHVLDAIGKLGPVNGATVASYLGITRGAVTKIARRFLRQGLIEKNFLPDNKKEVHFTLTALGMEFFKAHHELHDKLQNQWSMYLDKYDAAELQTIVRFLSELAEFGMSPGD
ncbi:MarR family winged helix-turn-helix transcriptional regulator [Alicyclobacillus acidoterrestris]|uniref:MarR family transcriptional regulator n=1 Tax=Alicyclobacillus acidoterrestris (strain ATCC 49025 / DSM 3922 / CIP 106132 / NCIMB 13137 / GD3B) TaxID=1356854 RepID=T0BYP8_ALIAG|nr:MarR family transcriptional regulator [Alicyclobacillus acidoterrestris]EPZ49203.1 hypothetical protein N007_21200 [Alicyclobacillus acidoterrestris ATCC 49025]UNO47880.1 MarR family transcriptional regulator [Alicyclobacillus acidoterrestris]